MRWAKGVQPTSLIVTVDDQGPSGAYRIQSDGLGDYVDDPDHLRANRRVRQPGVRSQAGTTLTRAEILRFDFSAPADPNNTYRPDESGQQLWKIKTNLNVVPGTPRITDLGVNGNPVSACYGSTVAHQNAEISYRANFNTASDPQGTNVLITHTSISPAVWTMVSSGPCGGTANRAALYTDPLTGKHPVTLFRGYYDLSFSLRLRAR